MLTHHSTVGQILLRPERREFLDQWSHSSCQWHPESGSGSPPLGTSPDDCARPWSISDAPHDLEWKTILLHITIMGWRKHLGIFPGIDFMKVWSQAFFIEIALLICAPHLPPTCMPIKASKRLGVMHYAARQTCMKATSGWQNPLKSTGKHLHTPKRCSLMDTATASHRWGCVFICKLFRQ